MGYWNYRVVKDDDLYYVTEVYYDDDGKVTSWAATDNVFSLNILAGWETYSQLKGTAELVLNAFEKPVLTMVDGSLTDG